MAATWWERCGDAVRDAAAAVQRTSVRLLAGGTAADRAAARRDAPAPVSSASSAPQPPFESMVRQPRIAGVGSATYATVDSVRGLRVRVVLRRTAELATTASSRLAPATTATSTTADGAPAVSNWEEAFGWEEAEALAATQGGAGGSRLAAAARGTVLYLLAEADALADEELAVPVLRSKAADCASSTRLVASVVQVRVPPLLLVTTTARLILVAAQAPSDNLAETLHGQPVAMVMHADGLRPGLARPRSYMAVAAALEMSEHVDPLLVVLSIDSRGVLTVRPDFNDPADPASAYRFTTMRGETYEYFVTHASAQPTPAYVEAERKLVDDIYARHLHLLLGRLAADRMPVITRSDTAHVHVSIELVEAADFELDHLYIAYYLHVPVQTGSAQCAWDLLAAAGAADAKATIFGATQIGSRRAMRSFGPLLDDRPEWTVPLAHPIDVSLVRREMSGAAELGGSTAGFANPILFLQVCSLDDWERHNVEGYGFLMLDGRAGSSTEWVPTWRAQGDSIQSMRRFFTGSGAELDDLSVVAVPGLVSPAVVSKYGLRSVSSGRVRVRVNTLVQRPPHVHARQVAAARRASSNMQPKGSLGDALGDAKAALESAPKAAVRRVPSAPREMAPEAMFGPQATRAQSDPAGATQRMRRSGNRPAAVPRGAEDDLVRGGLGASTVRMATRRVADVVPGAGDAQTTAAVLDAFAQARQRLEQSRAAVQNQLTVMRRGR
jgi:hypothetical protein